MKLQSSRLWNSLLLAVGLAPVFLAGTTARATTYYWDTTTTSTWNTGASWSNTASTGGTTGVVPVAADSVVFNQSSVNGAETVQLSQAQSITGMTFNNTGTTLLDSSSSTAQTLTLGSGGITISSAPAAGAVTIGNSTNTLNVALSAGQTWTNSSANTMTVVNGITSTGTSGTRALVLSGAGGFTLNGVIGNGGLGGTISLQDSSSGTTTLSAANNYTGGTWLSSGTLVANVADTGTGTSATAGALGAGGLISFRGGTLQYTSNSAGSDYSGRIVNSANSISINTNGQNVTFASALADSNYAGLTKSGLGALILNAANNYSGTTTINAGTLQLGNTLAAQNSTVSIGATNGLTFTSGTTSFTIGGLSGSSAEALTNTGSASVALTVGNNNLAASYSGALSGGGSLIKVGSGTQTLSNPNTYTGVTTVNNGTLNITGSTGASSAVGVAGGYLAGTGTVNGAVTVSSAGGINLANGSTGTLTLASTLSITGAAGANNLQFDLANGSAAADVLKVSGTPSVTNAGAAVIGLNQIGGVGSTVTAGTYNLIQGTSAASAANFALATSKAFHETFTLGASGNNITMTVGAGSAGDVTSNEYWLGSTSAWNTAQWYSNLAGTTTANTPGYNSNVVFAATGASNLTTTLGSDYEINSLTVNSGVGATSIGGTKTLSIDATSANSNTAGNGITVNNAAGTTISSKVGLSSNQTWTVGTGASLVASGVITDFGGAYGLTKAGSGNLTLSAANTYTGGTTLTTGTLTLTNANALTYSALTINPASSGATATLNLLSDTSTTFNTGLNTSVPSGAYGGSGSNYGIVVNTGLNTFANINVDNTGNSTTGNTLTVGNVLLTNPSTFSTQPTAPNANTGLVVTNAHGYNLNIGTLTRIAQNSAAIEVTNNMVNGTLSISNIVDYETNYGYYWFFGNTTSGLTKIGSYAYNTNQGDFIAIDSAGTVLFTGTPAAFFNGTYNIASIVVGAGTAEYANENSLMGNNISGGWTAGTDGLGSNAGSFNKITVKSGATLALYVGGTGGGGAGTFTAADIAILAPVAGNTSGGILGLDTTPGSFSYSSNLTASGMGLSKLGANTLTLSGANTYTGVTSIINGTLSVGNIVVSGGNSNIGNASSAVVLGGVTGGVGNTAGILSYTGGAASYTRGFTVAGAGGEVDNNGSGLLSISGNITGTGPLTIGGSANVTISSNFTTSGTTTSGSSPTVLPSSLTDNNAGTVTLSGTGNTYTGGTTVNSGTLTVSPGSSLGSTSGPLAVNNASTILNLSTSAATTVGSLSGTGASTINNGGSGKTFTVNQTTAATYAGTIAGAGGFTLGSSSTAALSLSGTQSYTGATTINNGTLALTAGSSLAGTAVTANTNGTLQIGTLGSSGSVTIGSSGAGSLNLASGSLTFANGVSGASSATVDNLNINSSTNGATVLTLNGGTINIGVGATSDEIVLGGTGTGLITSLTGSTTINLNVLTALNGSTQQLISWGSLPTGAGTFALGTVGGLGKGIYTLSLSQTSSGLFLIESATSSAYWTGTTSASWATLNNFTTNSGGTTARTTALDNLTSVIFNATANVVNPSSNTTLDANTAVDNVTFNVGGVVINSDATNTAGNTLTLQSGLTVSSGLGAVNETINSNVALAATQTWTVGDSNETLTVNGSIGEPAPSSGLIKAGAGKLVLTGTNTYSGSTQVIAGTLNIQGADALDGTSGITVSTLAALQLQGGIALVSTAPLTLNGTGTGTAGALENVSGSNTFSGPITLGSASSIGVDVAGDTLFLTANTITNGGNTLTLVGAGNGYISSPISGSGGLTMSSTGTWTLDGASAFSTNTYTGTTTVNSGTLQLASTGFGTLGNGSSNNVVVTGGTLDLNGKSQNIGSLSGSGGTVTNSTTSLATLKLTGSSSNTYSGSITGKIKLQQFGTGITTLAGANSFTGVTQIDHGAISVTNNSALGTGSGASSSGVTVASGAALQLSNNITTTTAVPITSLVGTGLSGNGALESISGNNTFTGPITLGTGGATIGADAGTLTLSSTIGGSGQNLTLVGAGNLNLSGAVGTGAGSLTMNGNGTLTLGVANTYSGGTNLNTGTLFFADPASLGSGTFNIAAGTTVNYTGSAGTVANNLNFTGSGNVVLGNTGSGAIVYSGTTTFASGVTTILGNLSGTDTYGGSIGSIGGVLLEKLGANTWNLTGSTNSVNGQILLYGGVLQIANASALPSGFLTIQGGVLQVQGGGTFARTIGSNFNWFGSAGFAALGGNLTLNINSGAQLAFSNTGSNQIGNSAGSGVIAFGSSTSDSQVILPNNINLNTTDTTEQNIYVTKGTGTDSVLLSGVLSNGSGTTAASGLNKIGNGTLILNNAGNSYSGYTSIIGGTLVAEANSPAAGPSTTGVFGSGNGPSGAPSTSFATITLGSASGTAFSNQGGVINPTLLIGGNYTITNPVNVNWTNGTGQTFGIGGYLDANSTFSGPILLNGAAATGNTFAVSQVATTGTNALNITGGITSTNGGNINFANVGAVNVSTTGITNGGATAVSVSQTGAGTTTMAATNTYTGATTLSAGQFNVTGSLAAGSAVAVNSGGSLGGTGSVGGTVTLASGGAVNLATNGSIGTLTVGGLTTTGGGAMTFEIGGGTTSVDKIADTGALTIAGVTTINIANLGGVTQSLTSALNTYALLTFGSGSATLSNFNLATTSLDSRNLSLNLVGNTLYLNVSSSATSTSYTVVTTAASTVLHAGSTTSLNTVVTNTGTGTADTLNYSGLGASSSLSNSITGAATSGGPLANNGGTASNGQTYTATTAGSDTISANGTGTNATLATAASGTPTGTTITVYSGQGTWTGAGSTGAWGGVQATPTNWTALGGTPGLDTGFTGVDAATFGAVSGGTSTATVSLNGASPNLNAINFTTATRSYTLAQGTGGAVTLSGTTPSINVTAGSHTISAPVILGSNTAITASSGTQLTISGQISGSGTSLSNTGAGTTILSSTTGNSYSGGTSITAGKVYLTNASGSATGSGAVGVSGTGMLNMASTGTVTGAITVSSGGSFYSGGVVSGTPATGTGTGAVLTAALNVNGGNLTFALNTGGSATFASPNLTTSYISTSSTVNFTGSNSISLVDLTNGGLTLRTSSPYLLISSTLGDLGFTGLVTKDSTGALNLDQDGYVVGTYVSGSNGSYVYNPIAFNQFGSNGVTPLNSNQMYLGPQLYLFNGDLEVVPEPGTWALMIGGLALLIMIQRRRNKLN